MEDKIIEHVFDFWREIGHAGNFIKETEGYTYTSPFNFSWPSNIFDINQNVLNHTEFLQDLKKENLPNSIAFGSNKDIEKLTEKGFLEKSQLNCMYLNLRKHIAIRSDYKNFEEVTNSKQIEVFAAVASASFNYPVLNSTIERIASNERIFLFLGKYLGTYVSCGILYLDKQGDSGIHMIGTLPKFQGKGLGKIMTKNLICKAYDLDKPYIYLMASEAGERIYSKMGFRSSGSIHNFSFQN